MSDEHSNEHKSNLKLDVQDNHSNIYDERRLPYSLYKK